MPKRPDYALEATEAPEGLIAPDGVADASGAPLERSSAPLRAHPDNAEIDELLHDWIMGHIAGGPISRQTECYNALWDALPALRRAIETRGS